MRPRDENASELYDSIITLKNEIIEITKSYPVDRQLTADEIEKIAAAMKKVEQVNAQYTLKAESLTIQDHKNIKKQHDALSAVMSKFRDNIVQVREQQKKANEALNKISTKGISKQELTELDALIKDLEKNVEDNTTNAGAGTEPPMPKTIVQKLKQALEDKQEEIKSILDRNFESDAEEITELRQINNTMTRLQTSLDSNDNSTIANAIEETHLVLEEANRLIQVRNDRLDNMRTKLSQLQALAQNIGPLSEQLTEQMNSFSGLSLSDSENALVIALQQAIHGLKEAYSTFSELNEYSEESALYQAVQIIRSALQTAASFSKQAAVFNDPLAAPAEEIAIQPDTTQPERNEDVSAVNNNTTNTAPVVAEDILQHEVQDEPLFPNLSDDEYQAPAQQQAQEENNAPFLDEASDEEDNLENPENDVPQNRLRRTQSLDNLGGQNPAQARHRRAASDGQIQNPAQNAVGAPPPAQPQPVQQQQQGGGAPAQPGQPQQQGGGAPAQPGQPQQQGGVPGQPGQPQQQGGGAPGQPGQPQQQGGGVPGQPGQVQQPPAPAQQQQAQPQQQPAPAQQQPVQQSIAGWILKSQEAIDLKSGARQPEKNDLDIRDNVRKDAGFHRHETAVKLLNKKIAETTYSTSQKPKLPEYILKLQNIRKHLEIYLVVLDSEIAAATAANNAVKLAELQAELQAAQPLVIAQLTALETEITNAQALVGQPVATIKMYSTERQVVTPSNNRTLEQNIEEAKQQFIGNAPSSSQAGGLAANPSINPPDLNQSAIVSCAYIKKLPIQKQGTFIAVEKMEGDVYQQKFFVSSWDAFWMNKEEAREIAIARIQSAHTHGIGADEPIAILPGTPDKLVKEIVCFCKHMGYECSNRANSYKPTESDLRDMERDVTINYAKYNLDPDLAKGKAHSDTVSNDIRLGK